MAGTRVLTIQEFLLRYAVGANPTGDDRAGPDALRAEIARHADRTMTVVTLSGTTAITRCGLCPKEETRPCTALRLMALPFSRHPAYRPEWWLPQLEDDGDVVQEDSAALGSIPLPREEPDSVAQPVATGRPILRQVAD